MNQETQNTYESNIFINKRNIECHLVVFYDTKTKISSVNSKHGDGYFVSREVKDANLAKFYFSDSFPSNIVELHLHAVNSGLRNKIDKSIEATKFETRDIPVGLDIKLDGYDWLEISIFGNGIIALTIRLMNTEDISDQEYLKLIQRPEYVRDAAHGGNPGKLVTDVWHSLTELESKVCSYLNQCEIFALTLEYGQKKKMCFQLDSSKEGKTIDNVNAKNIVHYLKRSRPYIGSIVNFSKDSRLDSKNPGVQRFAIACGRTTPEFLSSFVDAENYLVASHPPRNIYHPGPSLVFIGRRGWVCFKMEDRIGNPTAFQLGVTETVLFVIQAVTASIRATRRFHGELSKLGEKKLTEMQSGFNKRESKPFAGLEHGKISEFALFCSNARLNAPFEDINALLKAHVTTHTARAAIDRIKVLQDHDEIAERCSALLKNYSDSLNEASQFYRHRQDRTSTNNMYAAITAIVIAAASLVVLLFQVST